MPKSNIRRGPRRRFAKRRGRKSMARRGNVPEWASLSETVQISDGDVNTIYNNNDVQLAMFDRASSVAQGYQFFRMKKMLWIYKPLLDTFPSTGNTLVPYLYWVINKSGTEYPGLNLAWFVANGSKPIRFDDKSIRVSYKPAVSTSILEAGVPSATQEPNMPRTSPWLNTTKDAFLAQGFQPSQVSHTGHYLMVDSPGSANPMKYEVTLTVEFEFKKPNAAIPTGANAKSVVKATKKV